jgi:hypothetical protein
MILNTYATHHCTNGFVDQLLSLLQNFVILLNNLPKSHYEAKSLVQNLGLGYISIHACQNGCVLYWNGHEVVDQCLICGESRYILGCNKVPRNFLRHFPLVPQLKRMFKTPNPSKFMR